MNQTDFPLSVCVSGMVSSAVSVEEFFIPHHINVQLVPYVGLDTAGFLGHRDERG